MYVLCAQRGASVSFDYSFYAMQVQFQNTGTFVYYNTYKLVQTMSVNSGGLAPKVCERISIKIWASGGTQVSPLSEEHVYSQPRSTVFVPLPPIVSL